MSTKAGNGKIAEEVDRIQTLAVSIKYAAVAITNTSLMRAYAEEILIHCDNIDRIRKEAADHYT